MESRGLQDLSKLTLVLGIDQVYMSLLRIVLQAQILATTSEKPPGKGKVAEAVQWAISAMGENKLPFKATAAVFGCISVRESSPGLDSTILMEFEGSAMESDVLSSSDLQQETEHSDDSYTSATQQQRLI